MLKERVKERLLEGGMTFRDLMEVTSASLEDLSNVLCDLTDEGEIEYCYEFLDSRGVTTRVENRMCSCRKYYYLNN